MLEVLLQEGSTGLAVSGQRQQEVRGRTNVQIISNVHGELEDKFRITLRNPVNEGDDENGSRVLLVVKAGLSDHGGTDGVDQLNLGLAQIKTFLFLLGKTHAGMYVSEVVRLSRYSKVSSLLKRKVSGAGNRTELFVADIPQFFVIFERWLR